MKLRVLGTAVLAGVVLFVATPPPATAAPVTAAATPCRPGTPAVAPPTTSFYDPDRTFLGPDPVPSTRPVGPLLAGYHRFGGLAEATFLARYRSAQGWSYPPADGFLTVAGVPVRFALTLPTGGRIDRFGYPGGSYLAPAYTPFSQRALPPQNLNTPPGTPQSNFHLYCVLRAFTVDAGPVAPWFGQPGLGLQFKLEVRHLPDAGTALSVAWLIQHGYLTEERPR